MQLNIPPVIENIEEIKAIYDAEEKVGQQLENEISCLLYTSPSPRD